MGSELLVGRHDVLDEIAAAGEDAGSGRGRLVLLSGESGIGKTRLAEAAASRATNAGAEVFWASGWEWEGAPAYWPWIQLVRSYIERREPDELARELGVGGPEIARLVPDAADRLPSAERAVLRPLEPLEQRFRLFDAVASLFHRAGQSRPIFMVLDDLHWADPASVLLLRFLFSRLRASRLLVLGTFRTPDAESSALGAALPELIADARLIELAGLRPTEVGELLSGVTGDDPDKQFVATIHERTGGNPLFVRELGRLLVAQGRTADRAAGVPPIPAGVRSVIERRISLLPPACRDVLSAASVVGRDFGVDLVARIRGLDLEQAADAIHQAARMGIVAQEPAGRWRFTHGLVREVLYEGVAPSRRAQLHHAVAEQLERSRDTRLHLSELANHFSRASTPGALQRALEYGERAASAALEIFAFEEAAAQAARSLETLDRAGPGDSARRARLLLLLAGAQQRIGRTAEARETHLRAAEEARRCLDAETLGRAAIGFGYALQFGGGVGVDTKLVEMAEEALAVLPSGDSSLRVQLMIRLAFEIVYRDPKRYHALAEEAMAMARRLGDPEALGRALVQQHTTLFGADRVRERLAVDDELIGHAEAHRDTEALVWGRIWRVIDLVELGDIRGADYAIRAVTTLTEEARLPAYRWFPALWRAMRTLMEGRIADAEQRALKALEIGTTHGQGAIDHFGMQLIAIRREQGRLEELVPLIREGVERYPEIPSYRCALALAYAESAQEASARAEFERLAEGSFAPVPRDYNWTAALLLLSETCVALGDAERAQVLYGLLRPFTERFIVIGYATVCGGSVHKYLGTLAATMGDTEGAEAHLETALRRHREAGAGALSVRTGYELGRVLVTRDADRAAEVLDAARMAAGEFGMTHLTARIDEMTGGRPGPPDAQPNRFRRDGELWTVTFAGASVNLKDAKGIRDLARLLAVPGREIHALDLATADAETPVARAASGDELLDDRARAEYRARISDLQEEIETAHAANDSARADRAEAELEAITSMLSSAYGLGGRKRTTADPAERARKAVTERIRDSLRRIRRAHPDLGRHLDNSINTGTFCSYTPDRPIRWDV